MLKEEAIRQIEAFGSGDSTAMRARRQTLQLMREARNPFDRTADPDHVTVSAICFSPDFARLLLILHAKLARWLQPGGHVEGDDPDLESAARRELVEETGLAEAEFVPAASAIFDLDVHSIDRGACGTHYDIRFVYTATPRPPTSTMVWASPQEAVELGYPEAATRRLFHAALQLRQR